MHICVVNDHYSWQGGGQLRIQNLAVGFKKLGHRVTYISPLGMSDDINQLIERVNPGLGYLGNYASDLQLVKRASGLRCDLLIVELPNTMFKGFSALTGKGAGITSFDFGGLWTSIFDKGYTASNFGGWGKLRPVAQALEDTLTLALSRLPDLITAPSVSMTEFIKRFMKRDQVFVVHHPIDTQALFNPELYKEMIERVPMKYHGRRVAALAIKGKGAVETLARFYQATGDIDVVWQIIGPRPSGMILSENSSSKLWFTGQSSYFDVPKYLSACDFAVALVWGGIERLPHTLHNVSKIADYLSMGLPVITNTASAAEYALNAGFFEKDISNVIKRTKDLLREDGLLAQLNAKARAYAVENLDSTKLARRYIDLSLSLS